MVVMRSISLCFLFVLSLSVLASCSPASQKPLMPIEVTYREAMLGDGLVGVFHNSSIRQLAVLIALTNPTLNQTENYRLDLVSNETKEIGHLEG
jgi:hypothetical protein